MVDILLFVDDLENAKICKCSKRNASFNLYFDIFLLFPFSTLLLSFFFHLIFSIKNINFYVRIWRFCLSFSVVSVRFLYGRLIFSSCTSKLAEAPVLTRCWSLHYCVTIFIFFFSPASKVSLADAFCFAYACCCHLFWRVLGCCCYCRCCC
jgi:hypothetical protein